MFMINEVIRSDFPCLHQMVNGHPLVFLDSAASAQKPKKVIDCLCEVYSSQYANIHRGIYYLSEIATRRFEETRGKVAQFINALENEIIFTKGATESINLVAATYGEANIVAGDEIIISQMEHHANIVPWQQLAIRKKANLKIININDEGELDFEHYKSLLSNKTKIVAITYMSNALGSITPIKEIIRQAHNIGAMVMVDACQAIAHMAIDVKALDADFLAFSAHKLYGPNGVGVLYGKYQLLEAMPPYQMGGEMITSVSFQETLFQKPPLKFEAGTPAIAEVIAFGAAIDYLQSIDLANVHLYEKELLEFASAEISRLANYQIIGTAKNKAAVISFIHKTAHPQDIGAMLDQQGIAIRAGHHCAEPLMRRLGVSATARASIGIYTNQQDIAALINALKKVDKIFAG